MTSTICRVLDCLLLVFNLWKISNVNIFSSKENSRPYLLTIPTRIVLRAQQTRWNTCFCSQPFSNLGVLKTSKTIWVSKCSALPKTSCTFSHGVITWKSYSLYSHQIKLCFCASSQNFSNSEEIISHFAVEDPWTSHEFLTPFRQVEGGFGLS